MITFSCDICDNISNSMFNMFNIQTLMTQLSTETALISVCNVLIVTSKHYGSSCHTTACHVTLRLVMSHYDLLCHATARHVTLRLCNSTNNIMHDGVQGELYMKRDCVCEERQLVLLRPSVVDQVQHRCLFLTSGVSSTPSPHKQYLNI